MTKGIILAAGRGSRMGGLTADQPKCFTRLHGRRLLDLQLEALRGSGITDIAVVRGYRRECFTEPLRYFDNVRWQETNMVASLSCAMEWLQETDCIVSYSDIFYSAQTVAALSVCTQQIAISYDPDWLEIWGRRFADPLTDAETFGLHADGTLAEIGARPAALSEVTGQFMGLIRMTPTGWSKVVELVTELGPETADRLDMTSLLRLGLAAGWAVGAVPVLGPWGEVDSESDLAAYSARAFEDSTHRAAS